MTEHWRICRTGKCRGGCPGCASKRRSRAAWVWATVGAVLVVAAFPARGLLGVALALTGVAVSAVALRIGRQR